MRSFMIRGSKILVTDDSDPVYIAEHLARLEKDWDWYNANYHTYVIRSNRSGFSLFCEGQLK